MDFEIHPLKGVNEIEFGMDAETVARMIGQVAEKFERHDESYPSDHFVDVGAFGYYDPNGLLEAVELTNPAGAMLGSFDLLDMSFGQAASLLKQIDPAVTTDIDMVTSNRLSLSIWSSKGFSNQDDPVEAVLIGRSGYYA